MALFHSSVPVSHDSVIVSQQVQHQQPESEALTCNMQNSHLTAIKIIATAYLSLVFPHFPFFFSIPVLF